MGRSTEGGDYKTSWSPPDYTVDDAGRVQGGYQPSGPSNWGRWGEDDQLGTQNLIGPDEVVTAAGLVNDGKVFSLALPIDADGPRWPTRPAPLRLPLMTGADQVVGSPYAEEMPNFQWNDDMLQMPTQGSTQWDALSHVMNGDTMYNGFWAGNVTAYGGAKVLGIETFRQRFIGRGVLLDLARHQGVDSCPDSQAIGADMLDACLDDQGVELRPGDMLLIRTGHLQKWWGLTSVDEQMAYFLASPGLSATVVSWLKDNDVAAVASDTIAVEPMTPEDPDDRVYPLHQGCLIDLGLPLGEFWVLDDLAADCAQDGRYAFMLVAPPLYLPGSLGSPINPVAIK